MIRSLLIAAAALSLSACAATGPVASAGSAPAQPSASAVTPLANTAIDDKAIVVAFQALDATATAADALLAAGVIQPGSQSALRLANGLESAKTWLNIASQAQKAAQAENYVAAIAQASAALTSVRSAIGGN